MKIRIAAFAGEGRIEPLHCISLEIKSGQQGDYLQLFLEPEWALSQEPIWPKAEWAIDSEAMRREE